MWAPAPNWCSVTRGYLCNLYSVAASFLTDRQTDPPSSLSVWDGASCTLTASIPPNHNCVCRPPPQPIVFWFWPPYMADQCVQPSACFWLSHDGVTWWCPISCPSLWSPLSIQIATISTLPVLKFSPWIGQRLWSHWPDLYIPWEETSLECVQEYVVGLHVCVCV